MPGDNFDVTVCSDMREHLDSAIDIIFYDGRDREIKAVYYNALPDTLILYCCEPTDKNEPVIKLPYDLNIESVKDFCWNWLQSAAMGVRPDHDGSNKKGFLVTCESHWFGKLLTLKTEWQMYGK